MAVLPMFPLGSTVLPHVLLPLHVFEERYRALARRLSAEPDFGTVLIERGHEVGGGDTRFTHGTLVRTLDAEELPDGRWVVAAVGVQRLRVLEWLDDDPYPRAEIELLEDRPAASEEADRVPQLQARLEQVLDLHRQVGGGVPDVDTTLAPDPVVATWQAAALAPLQQLDRQQLLGIDVPAARLDRVLSLLDDTEQLLQAL
ncbi:MAG: LON peptidase substrate-binding domain-containing protein [Actinobacteria bacterium]|nr:LON peptidase substrate-binding domain-containing protein [Actinomycetota bacterium]